MNHALRIAFVTGLASLGFRLWFSGFMVPIPPDTENISVGNTLATKGYFGDPFFTPTGPTAHVAPLYPALIAAGTKVTGSKSLGLKIGRGVLTLALGVFVCLLPWIARSVGLSAAVGAAAALAFFFPSPPVFWWIELTGQHETVLTAVLLAMMTAATVRLIRNEGLNTRHSALLGIGWGAAMYASPTLILPMVVAFSVPAVLTPQQGWRLLRTLPAMVVSFVFVVSPWIVRNELVLGKAAFIRDNFGMELAVSNSDDASPDMRENMKGVRSMTRHPYFSSEAAVTMRQTGEIEFYEQKKEEAFQWIRNNPRRFLSLTVDRVGLFFLPRLGREHHAYFYGPVLLLWLGGTLHLLFFNPVVALTLNGVLFAYAMPHFLIQSSPRYSYPVLWIMVLIACHMGEVLFRRTAALASRKSRVE